MCILLESLPWHPSFCWYHSTYPGSNCQRLVVINMVKKCPLSIRIQQLFVLGINRFDLRPNFIPVTCFRCYFCWVSFVAILHSFNCSKCCLHEIFHPQFCVHFLLHHTFLSPPPNPHLLLQHLHFVQTGVLNLFRLPMFFVFDFLPDLRPVLPSWYLPLPAGTILLWLFHRSVSFKLYIISIIHFLRWPNSCGTFFSNSIKIF